MAFYRVKKNKLWLIKAVDCTTRTTIAWVLGKRDVKTFRKLYNKVKHLEECLFYTDNWDAFAKVLPKSIHIIGKAHTLLLNKTIVILGII